MSSEAARQLRLAADCVDACALSDAEQDLIELIAHHVKHRCTGGASDRLREGKLLMRRLDHL